MKVEFEKTMLISSELLSYCHLMGADEYHLDIKVVSGVTVFAIKAFPTKMSDEDLKRLRKKLGTPRQREMEQEFWGLSGESETVSELTLVGMMSDEADVEYKDGVLSITIKRGA